jgi:hypothetical protein
MKNYEVKNPEVNATLTAIAGKIRPAIPDGWGFMLMIFEFGPDGACFYASSAERVDVLAMMQEWIDKQKRPR